jgi:hypothetical protein
MSHRFESFSKLPLRVVAALALIAVALIAASAPAKSSAASRMYECAKLEKVVSFADAHCKTEGTGFALTELTNGIPMLVVGTNNKTASGTSAAAPTKIEGFIGETEAAVECAQVSAEMSLTDSATFVSGVGTIEYSSCTVNKPPGQGCLVKGAKFTTTTLELTTEGMAANLMRIKPLSGTTIATVPISGCSTPALNASFPISGSMTVTSTGATLSTTHSGTTEQKSLKFAGKGAGIEGALTLSTEEGATISFK